LNSTTLVVSVLNYCNAGATVKCIQSLHEACGVLPHEFIVGDHSPESQIAAIRAALNDHVLSRVCCVHRPENPGFAAGHNENFRTRAWKGSELFLVINNDVEVEDSELFPAMVAHCHARTIVGCIITTRPEGDIWFGGGRINRITGDLRIRKSRPAEEIAESEVICGCCMLMRAEDFAALQGFDERFFMYAEDVDLSLRAGRLGYRRILVNRSLGHWVGSGRDGKYSSLYLYENTKNRLICLNRYRPGLPLIRVVHFVLKYLILRIAQLVVFSEHPLEQSRLVFRAFRDGLRIGRTT
jgi:hypothetical protein